MEYVKILEEKAKKGFEEFIEYIRDDRNLLYNVDEVLDETEVEVEIFDDDMGVKILGTYYFNEKGNFVRSL